MSSIGGLKVLTQTYGERATRHSNAAARQLLETMERKRSNLCVSVDVAEKEKFLKVVDAVGPYACLIKVNSHLALFQLNAQPVTLDAYRHNRRL